MVRVCGDGVALSEGGAGRDVACVAGGYAGGVDERVDDPECALVTLIVFAYPASAEVPGKSCQMTA